MATAAPAKNGRTKPAGMTGLKDLGDVKVTGETEEVITYTIKLPAPAFTRFGLHLKGTSPLIVDAFSQTRKDKLAKSQDGSPKSKPGPRVPGDEFEEALYRTADGRYGVPKLAFRKAIATAATRMTEHKGTEVLAAFQIDSTAEYLPLDEGSVPQMRMDHVVRMGRGNVAYRPEFPEWGLWLPVKLDHEVLTLDAFVTLVNKAGIGVGIGNWRAEKKGDFGLWEVDDISEVTRTTGVKAA